MAGKESGSSKGTATNSEKAFDENRRGSMDRSPEPLKKTSVMDTQSPPRDKPKEK